MQSFVDEVRLEVSSGHGGAGAVSFRREKYIPRGGPDGGDGGRGGDVIFQVKSNLKTFSHLITKHSYRAKNGHPGMGSRRHGSDGEDAVITVPPGTLVRDGETGEVLKDLSFEGESWIFLKGGLGGKGNYHFKTSRKQAPRYSQPGLPGSGAVIRLELNLIADIGFVGLPNAGKSTLLKVLTNANPEVGAYPFTTKIPNLGVLRIGSQDIVIADIPGIIAGASQGAGLGFRFLKHIARTASLVFLIDVNDQEPLKTYETLIREISEYGRGLEKKSRIVLATKTDQDPDHLMVDHMREHIIDPLYPLSAMTHQGLEEVKKVFLQLASKE